MCPKQVIKTTSLLFNLPVRTLGHLIIRTFSGIGDIEIAGRRLEDPATYEHRCKHECFLHHG